MKIAWYVWSKHLIEFKQFFVTENHLLNTEHGVKRRWQLASMYFTCNMLRADSTAAAGATDKNIFTSSNADSELFLNTRISL